MDTPVATEQGSSATEQGSFARFLCKYRARLLHPKTFATEQGSFASTDQYTASGSSSLTQVARTPLLQSKVLLLQSKVASCTMDIKASDLEKIKEIARGLRNQQHWSDNRNLKKEEANSNRLELADVETIDYYSEITWAQDLHIVEGGARARREKKGRTWLFTHTELPNHIPAARTPSPSIERQRGRSIEIQRNLRYRTRKCGR
jgi:hypothetical protein